MKKIKSVFLLLFVCFSVVSNGQLKGVFIEKYYISDGADALDTIGGELGTSTTTYRLFLELEPNTRVKQIFGDSRHPFQMGSSLGFFNNISQGKSFGKDFTKASLSENTVALDTYLTIGQVAKQGAKVFFALPKSLDHDGSFIGGANNDGGSTGGNGLLSAQNNEAGIPLTLADGNDTLSMGTLTWNSTGVQDIITGLDTTIFGSSNSTIFFSNSFYLESSQAIGGIDLDTNVVLVAQLTTQGELYFDINVELEVWENGQWNSMVYVSKDTLLQNGEIYNPYLSYPYACGCMNPDYLEYSPIYVCELEGSCQHLIVYGCMDTLACNYSVDVNVHVQELCCYPGSCNNRNLIEVCPSLMGAHAFDMSLFPNPATEEVNINVLNADIEDVEILIYNANGALMQSQKINRAPYNLNLNVDLLDYQVGIYQVLVRTPGKIASKLFFKN